MRKHTWKKKGNPDREADKYVRAWTCSRCAASKRRVTRGKRVPSHRTTLERSVSSEKCLP